MPTIVTLIFLLLSIAIIVTITLVQVNQKQILSPGLKRLVSIPLHPFPNLTGIVLDAGSSRTTVYVYEWPAEKENNTGVISQTFKCDVKGPGISSYGSNPQEISMPINNCMNKVKEKIPFHLHKSVPVYLGATAGMRLLRLQNESAANEVLQNIQTYFMSQPFEFKGAQIITCQEEGVYGWITANYLKGNFLEVDNSSIAWSLGYMLSLTNMIPAESNRIWLPMNPSLFAGLLLFFTAVVLLCLIFLVYSYVRSHMQKNTCQVEHVFAIE